MRLGFVRGRSWTTLVVVVGALLASGVAGAAAESTAPLYVTVGIVVFSGLWILVERFGASILIGLLILAAVNVLPGPDLASSLHNSISYQDVVVIVLLIALYQENAKDGFRYLRGTAIGRLLPAWSALFMAWYGYTVVHTWFGTPVPLLHAITFSRQFPYMALVLPVLTGVVCNPESRKKVLLVVGVGVFVNCLAQIGAVAGHLSLGFLLHVNYSLATNGLTRIRGAASDIPFAALPLGYGLWLYGETNPRRRAGLALAVVGLAAIAVGQTRAIYVGAGFGLCVAMLLAVARVDLTGKQSRRGLATTAVALVAVGGIVYAYVPSSFSTGAVGAVVTRANSLISDAGSGAAQDGSLLVREADIRGIDHVLRGHWLTGLGELDATYVSFPDLPQGDIEQTDISLLSAVAMIGLVGLGIYSIPLLVLTFSLVVERLRTRSVTPDEWLAFGCLAWCFGTLIVSFTLGLLFDPAQVIGSALMLALGFSVLATRKQSALLDTASASAAARSRPWRAGALARDMHPAALTNDAAAGTRPPHRS